MDAVEKTQITRQGRCWLCRGSGHRRADSCCPSYSACDRKVNDIAVRETTKEFSDGTAGEIVDSIKSPEFLTLSSLSLDLEEKLKNGKHMSFSIRVNNRRALTLLDSGSEGDLLDYSHARTLKTPMFKLRKPIPLHLGNGKLYRTITEAALVDVEIGDHREQLICYLTDIPRYQLILGDKWLQEHNPQVNWKDRSITFNSPDCFAKGCLFRGRPCTKYTARSRTVKPPEADPVDVSMISAYAFYKLARKQNHEGFLLLPRDHEKYFAAATTNAITAEDYESFMRGKRDYTLAELKKRVPTKYHSEIEVFIKREADNLRPHGPEDHEIRLTEGAAPPFARNYKPMSAQELDAVKKYLDEQLAKGFIRPSSSSVASPILLVRKPGGGIRVCVDYRALNEITIKNRYPIPLVSETLDRLSKAKIFSKFDIIHAFNRIRVKEGQEWLTAFNTRYGQFEYLVMPFGLCNAPGTFQNYINEAVRDYLDHFCTAYMDDILVYSNNEEEHTDHVLKVLRRLRERKLQLDIDKCDFDAREVKYLGLIITSEGIRMDPEKLKAIRDWQTPASVVDVQQFVGFCSFYRRFIQNFSRYTRPLNELTKGESYLSRTGKRKMRYKPFVWTEACQQAFDGLKDAFETAPILIHFDPERETWIETDASDFVTAGIISQMVDGVLRPVAFFSRKMNPAECNYMIYDKELLAIIRAFELWRPEAASVDPSNPVKVYTDHRNLEYFMTTKQLTRRQARWAEFLSEFNFKIMYRPGKQGQKPDYLTRRSQDLPKGSEDDREKQQFQTLLQSHQLDEDIRKALAVIWFRTDTNSGEDSLSETSSDIGQDIRAIETIEDEDPVQNSQSATPVPADITPVSKAPGQPDVAAQPERTLEELIAEAYEQDQVVQDIMVAKERGERKLPRHILARGVKLSMGNLTVKDHRLWIGTRLYVPENEALRLRIMELYHKERMAGHPGPKAMYRNLMRNYFWLGMKQDCVRYANHCRTCWRVKARNVQKQGLLQPLPIPQQKWMDISIDFIEDVPPCKRHGRTYRHLLVVVDRLTKGRILEPMRTKGMEEVVEVMHRRVFCVKGLPLTIVSDRGTAFVSTFCRRYCERYGVKNKLSSSHHPETDGQTEIANKMIKNFLRSFINYLQDDWVDWVPDAEFTANNHANESTGMTPFFASYGHHPRTGAEPPKPSTTRNPMLEAADKLVDRTEAIRQWLQDEICWAQEEQERQANKHRAPHPEYRLGDLVYVNAKHFAAQRPSVSLGYKNAGPWPIIRIIDNKAYELRLPDHMLNDGVHPVFHPWKLHLAPNNPYPGQVQEPQPAIIVTGDEDGEDEPHEEWQVAEIVDCRETRKYGIQYKAQFEGNWDEWNANPPWQPWSDFKSAADKVIQYHLNHPEKPQIPYYFAARETSPR